MEKNYSPTDQSAVAFDRALSLPHFDEDATLLSAQPVVPLREVNAKMRFRRAILGLTVVAAILVGAISGTLLLLRSYQNSQRASEAESNQPALSSAVPAGGPTAESAEATMPEADTGEKPRTKNVPNASDSLIKRRIRTEVLPAPPKPARAANPESDRQEYLQDDERELRRADRRNARREARRELRQRRDRQADDLLRIREIFEGPRP